MERAVCDADTAVILFPSPTILGAAIEFGIAIGSQLTHPAREIIVVEPIARQSVFYAHPHVLVVEGISGVRNRPWY